MGLAAFPSPALSQAINPRIVQKTLNPLPASVLIPRSAFTGSLISLVPHPGAWAKEDAMRIFPGRWHQWRSDE